MPAHFHPSLVKRSFNRLAPICAEGKKTGERTSAIFYFLACDAAMKSLGTDTLNLDPDSDLGKRNRDAVTVEFARLVMLKKDSSGEIRHVTAFGSVEIGGTDPEKRISSNFLTVPLKKASLARDPDGYPKRPAPLLSMGPAATGSKWGVKKHPDWQANLPTFLTELKSNTPFTDMAILVCRNHNFPQRPIAVRDGLKSAVSSRFTKPLADWLMRRISMESRLAKCQCPGFSNEYHEPLEGVGSKPRLSQKAASDQAMRKRIKYLEGLLDNAGINHQQQPQD
jgi:hypothetical protein